jgi:hypothetical protein
MQSERIKHMITTQELTCSGDVRDMLAESKITDRPVDLERVLSVTLDLLEDKENDTAEDDFTYLDKKVDKIKETVRKWEDETMNAADAIGEVLLIIDSICL